MEKITKVGVFILTILVLFILCLLLKLTYNDGTKRCIEYGYSENYCKTELKK